MELAVSNLRAAVGHRTQANNNFDDVPLSPATPYGKSSELLVTHYIERQTDEKQEVSSPVSFGNMHGGTIVSVRRRDPNSPGINDSRHLSWAP